MSSLVRLVKKLQEKKSEVTKLKRKAEREFEKAKFLQKRSASGLVSIEKRVVLAREHLSDVSNILNHKLAQQESIQRLLVAAEERLNRENEAKERTKHEIEFAESAEEKKSAQARLNSILDGINDITFEIKQRKKMGKTVTDTIEEFKKSKSKISIKIHKEVREKPELQNLIKKSKKYSERFATQFASKIRLEESAQKHLEKVTVKLDELQKQRRKLVAQRPKRKAAKRKVSKPQRKAAKRKVSKPQRKAAKRKVSKPQRKAAKRS